MSDDTLTRLSDICGIIPGYWNIAGVWQEPHHESKLKILEIFGFDVSSPQVIEQSLEKLIKQNKLQIIKPVHVVSSGNTSFEVTLQLPSTSPVPNFWKIALENGKELVQSLTTEMCKIEENYEIEKQEMKRVVVSVNTMIPDGYHTLSLTMPRPDGSEIIETSLIATPERCYLPNAVYQGSKYWGVTLQLYSLRSNRNWGIGDLGDLRKLAHILAAQGATFIGLNPLHALPTHDGTTYSPYSPVSRFASNYLYLDLDGISDFQESATAQAFAKSSEVESKLEELRKTQLVDYKHVSELKEHALRLAYDYFCENHLAKETERSASFYSFRKTRGKALEDYSTYQALREYFISQDSLLWGWPVWPEGYKSPESELVKELVNQEARNIGFFCYLEWQFECQIKELRTEFEKIGISNGLYLDLALGCGVNSADVWASQELYSLGASIGAPPDDINECGQNWGLPVLLPSKLEQSSYRPFIDLLRYVMSQANMLRIDHVMQLMRLFWIPTGLDGTHGLYIRYPISELMGIIALESQRNKCVVIGEDLGTVPNEVRLEMRKREILSYQLLIFQRNHLGEFIPPEAYVPQALVTSSSHDLPTIMGFWKGREITLRRELGWYDVGHEMCELTNRIQDLSFLVAALANQGVILPEDILEADDETHNEQIVAGINSYLAKTPCYFHAIQLEDICLNVEQMNFPGTTFEHPNWQRKVPVTVDFIENLRARFCSRRF